MVRKGGVELVEVRFNGTMMSGLQAVVGYIYMIDNSATHKSVTKEKATHAQHKL